MDVPVRFIDSIINNPLLMQFLVYRWFFLLEYDPRLDQLRGFHLDKDTTPFPR